MVDAGTVDLVRELGAEVVSSAELVQQFTATLSDAQIDSHRRAADVLPRIVKGAMREVRTAVLARREICEYDIQQFIVRRMADEGFASDPDEPPIVGVNANASDPHYSPSATDSAPIREGDWLLLDQWCREPGDDSVWADITWCAYVGREVPERHAEIFDLVRSARDAAIDLIRSRYAAGRNVAGYEADRAARGVIESAGLGEHFVHRTGHSITYELHGTGAHLDDLETHDYRNLVRRSCFSVEPGVYLPDFGVRLEVNVLIPAEGPPEVTGEQQDAPIALLSDDCDL
jgi:Xaa-Pro aminopeptidase